MRLHYSGLRKNGINTKYERVFTLSDRVHVGQTMAFW